MLLLLQAQGFLAWLRRRGWEQAPPWFLWVTFLSFPSGFIAVLTGWFTAEVGRQPWVVFGLLRTADAVTPSLGAAEVWASLLAYIAVYTLIFSAGTFYIYRLMRDGPAATRAPKTGVSALRPLAAAGPSPSTSPAPRREG